LLDRRFANVTRGQIFRRYRDAATALGCAALLIGGSLLACRSGPPRGIIRLGTLLAVDTRQPLALGAAHVEATTPWRTDRDIAAPRVARLRFRGHGKATLATVSWKLSEDRGFPAFRSLSFPLVADEKPQVYEVDLQREPYWSGQVSAIRVGVDRGSFEITELSGLPPTDPYRSMSLKGDALPALPGVNPMAFRLPALPHGSTFEVHLGLLPEYDRPGTRAVFRILRSVGGRQQRWIEEVLNGSGGEGGGWHLVRRDVPDGTEALSLEVHATRAGEALPEGAALWGDPVLLTPGKRGGPNLVVILIDTLRADVLGAYGDRAGLTPNLDGFARQAVRLDELLAPSSWTLPSVASFMTGLEPQTHGAGVRFGTFAPTGLAAGTRTMASTLAGHGFYTLGVYHNIYVNPAFGLQAGFDEYDSREERAATLVDAALDRLQHTAPDRRVFLYLHLFDAHTPYDPPSPECPEIARRFSPDFHGSLGCYGDRRPERPLAGPEDQRWMYGLYRAEVAYIDRQVGRFLAGLRRLGLADQTAVAIVSDHGEEFWSRYDREKAMGYEANSDHGHTLYQELVHVPGLLRIPGQAPLVVHGPLAMVDLFPTLLHAVGVEPPPSQGIELSPRFAGHPAELRTFIADLILHGAERWSVRRGRWKLIVPVSGVASELYDLERDPGEQTNLAASLPALVTELRGLGEREIAERQRRRASFRSGADALSATYLEWNHITKLRSLGYLR
jgi:arylsulfatase A-like enzyme